MLPALLAAGGAYLAANRLVHSGPRPERWFKGVVDELRVELQLGDGTASAPGPSGPPATLVVLDKRYQRFVVEKFDPFFGKTRRAQLSEISSSGGSVAISDYERRLNRYVGAAAVSMGTAVAGFFFPPIWALTVAAALYSTMLIFRNGYNALVKEHKLRMDVMGSLYFIGAFAGGYFIAGSFGLLAYYMSEKLLLITRDRSTESLVKIFGEQPRTVWLLVDGAETEVPVEQVQAGDTVVVQAGQVIPVDGVITDGIATVDQHMLTGESQPVEKGVGDQVLTATLLLAGKIHVGVEKTGEETAAAQIGTILNNTASYQAGIVSRGELVADRSVPPTMLIAVLAWPFVGYRYGVTILGSAIGLNIKITAPIAMLNFLNVAANHGILVKDGRSLELLKDVDTVVFDKTGTLTLDQPRVAKVHTCTDVDPDTVLMYAAAAEHRQTHPIARAILDEASDRGIEVPDVDPSHYEMGYGLTVQLDGQLVRVGSDRYMALEKITRPARIRSAVGRAQKKGHSMVMVAVNGGLVGAIELEPILRPEAEAVVRELRKRNLDLYIISGDQEEPTRRMADALGIDHFFADTLPEEKATLVAGLQSEGRSVCFVGDGINDSISLKRANVSMSLRGASTAAIDTAQIVLMGQGLQQIPFLFQLSQEFDVNMRAGFAVAVGQGVVVIAGALLGVVGIIGGTLIWSGGLLAGVGIAQLPLRRHHISGRPAPPPALPAGEAPAITTPV